MFALRLGRLRPAAALRGQPFPYSNSLALPISRSLHATPVAAKKVIRRSSLTPTQRKALAKQRQLAQAILKDDGSVLEGMQPNPLPSAVPDAKLSLADLERFKPSRMPKPLTGTELPNKLYAKRYEELEKNLNYAFTREQVVKLARLLNLRTRKSETKNDLVRRVMVTAWGFEEPLAPVETSTFERSELVSLAELR